MMIWLGLRIKEHQHITLTNMPWTINALMATIIQVLLSCLGCKQFTNSLLYRQQVDCLHRLWNVWWRSTVSSDYRQYNGLLQQLVQMGQQSSQLLDCRLFGKDNSSEIKHKELLQDLKLMQQHDDQKRILSLKQRNKSTTQLPHITKVPTLLINHEHILRYSPQPFPKAMEFQSGGFIEIPDSSLADILEPKFNTASFLPVGDVHAMLGGLLSAMSFLQQSNIDHHDIYPSSIYHSASRYKLSNPITAQSSYIRAFQGKRFSFLSPELIEAVVNEVPIQDHTLLFKPDVYSLGMVMLECCSLKPSSQCYDPQTYETIEANIRNRLNIVEAKYSPQIASLIKAMLQPDPKRRLSASQVFELFKSQPLHQRPPTEIPVFAIGNSQLPFSPSKNVNPPASMANSMGPNPNGQFNIVVTPPPPGRQSIDIPSSQRGPQTEFTHANPMTGGRPTVNLQELDGRIVRILANSNGHN